MITSAVNRIKSRVAKPVRIIQNKFSLTRDGGPILLLQLRRLSILVFLTASEFGGMSLRRLLARKPVDAAELAKRLRHVLERMGLTYVKLGQFLATRQDLLPREVIQELGRLFQRVEPMPMVEVRQQIEAGLGLPVAELFDVLDPKPLGSASVAQVHRARRSDGRWIAVKVQRIGVARAFEADMRSLRLLASLIGALRLEIGVDVEAAVEEFSTYTARELDFRVEAATDERVRAQGDRTIFIPSVHHDLSCATVLTLDLVVGTSLSEIYAAMDEGQPAPRGLSEAAETLAQAIFRQLFIFGFFHGDPHPGNIMLTDDGRVALVDFGIFGMLDARQLADVRGYIEALATGSALRAYHYYARMLSPTRWSEMEGFRREAVALLQTWQAANADPTTPKSEVMVSAISDRLLNTLRKHHVALRLDTLLFWRAVILLDANFSRPELRFDLNQSLQRFFASEQASPARQMATQLMRPKLLQDISDLRGQGPRRIASLLGRDRGPRLMVTSAPQTADPAKIVAAVLLATLACIVAGCLFAR